VWDIYEGMDGFQVLASEGELDLTCFLLTGRRILRAGLGVETIRCTNPMTAKIIKDFLNSRFYQRQEDSDEAVDLG